MRGFLKFAWLPLLALPLVAAPVTSGTANWQVVQTSTSFAGYTGQAAGTGFDNGRGIGVSGAAVVLSDPIPTGFGWAAETNGSQWIGQLATDGNFGCPQQQTVCGGAPGTYVYTLTLANVLAGTLNFSFASDNAVTFRVLSNGNQVYNSGVQVGFALTTPSAIAYSAGSLVLEATVQNGYSSGLNVRNPTGLLVIGATTDNPPPSSDVPEPSTYAMLGLGGAGLLVARMRRGK